MCNKCTCSLFVLTERTFKNMRSDTHLMATERLTKRLQDLGLEKTEAELYIFLSATGPTPARVVARRFNQNRMKAYRSLKALEDKGLIQSLMGRPIRYLATPLGDVLNRQKGGLKQRLADLEQNSDALIEEWKSLASGAVQSYEEESRFRIFRDGNRSLTSYWICVTRPKRKYGS